MNKTSKVDNQTIGFVGGGQIAFCIGSGLITRGHVKSSHVYVSGPNIKNLEKWRQLGVHVTDKNGIVVTKCDIIFLCVKPHVLYQCAQQIEGYIEPAICDSDKLFVSTITGATNDRLELAFSFMNMPRIIRAIPNTPVQVGEGCTIYVPGRFTTPQDLENVHTLFGLLGIAEQVPENLMNALAALTACGPAYVFTIIKAMADGMITQSVNFSDAIRFSAQTFVGAAKMVLETKKHPAILRDEICKPGGAAIAGLHELEKIGIRNGFINAIERTTKKHIELGTFS